MTQVQMIMVLLVLYQLKHFLADYIFQNAYHLGKFKREGWQMPLLNHCSYHGLGTGLVFMLAGWLDSFNGTNYINHAPWLFCVTFIDMVVHFIVDRIKAHPDLLGKYKMDDKRFWWALGWDQMMHHLTHYLIIFMILS